jgi:hypothetical protein
MSFLLRRSFERVFGLVFSLGLFALTSISASAQAPNSNGLGNGHGKGEGRGHTEHGNGRGVGHQEGPTGAPIDGGASLLLAGGAAYAVRRIRQARRK